MSFNRSKAIEYARQYWNDYNPNFESYANDCTNFVSQCWNYAGIPMTLTWHGGKTIWEGHPGVANTNSWVSVPDFYDYMVNNEITTVKWSSTEVNIGDVIQFWNPGDEAWTHAGIITNLDTPYGITYAGHTDDHFQRPLSDVYPDSYTEVRFLCPIDTID